MERVYNLQGTAEAETVYDEWAGTYDTDTVERMGYVGPRLAAAKLVEVAPDAETVLDAGCGTGLAGLELAQLCAATIDGVDLSAGMLAQAGTLGVYRTLAKADLTKPLEFADDSYDAAMCVGTFTDGHVGPDAFDELVRVVRPGGVVVATVMGRVWESGGYREHLNRLVERATVELRESAERPYHEREGITCRLVVLEVLPPRPQPWD
ncbi:MAG: methyltransferase domain-containing protein [Streptosporangiales bacterium]|nr:methyltransferase domain-containing protein [Streptosporangiales bacterium]